MPQSTFDKVVDLLRTVIEIQDSPLKIESINLIKELIVFKEPSLLDNFYEEILNLIVDKSPDVRVAIVDFIETSCKTDTALLNKSLTRLRYLVEDESFAVLKKLAATMMTIYRLALTQAVKTRGKISEEVESFQLCIYIVEELIKKDDSPNGGFILRLIKLIESVVILQSKRSSDSETPKMRESDMSLDQIADNIQCPCLQINKLEQHGILLFQFLLRMLNRDNFSSSHVHTLLTCLTNIGKQRPQFLRRVIESFELTHVNMSEKLGEVQVNSIRKALKSNLIILLKLSGNHDLQGAISSLLTDLGATQQEISRNLPKIDDVSRKRKRKEEMLIGNNKRTRTTGNNSTEMSSDFMYNDSVIRRFAPKPDPINLSDNYVEQMSKELIPKLNKVINVADLVLLSMIMLPDTMPPAFQSAYTPIAAAGTESQIAHLSRLLANQLISAGHFSLESKDDTETQDNEGREPSLLENFNMAGLIGIKSSSGHQSMSSKKQKQFNLVAITKPLPPVVLELLIKQSYNRILSMPLLDNMLERSRINTHPSSLVPYSAEMANLPKWYFARNKILTSLPSSIFGGAELYFSLVTYCLSDIKNKFDTLLSLVMQEFIHYKAFHLAKARSDSEITPRQASLQDYDIILVTVLNKLITSDVKETYFGRMLLEAPLLTSNALETLRSYCSVKVNADYGFQIVKDLMSTRPDQRQKLLTLILDFSSDETIEIRTAALNAAKWIITETPQYADEILDFAKSNLNGLLKPKASNDIYPLRNLIQQPSDWTEDLARSCLYLFLALMPVNNALIHLLSSVFADTCQVNKRTILRIIDIPIREMGIDSAEILNLVENCSNSQEILIITRIIHILTDKSLPSPLLVDRIKTLYHGKFPDARLIVPILKGLTKAEIIKVLPKLVTLSDKVMAEAFRRLLDVNAFDAEKGDFILRTSPILPQELLIAVHQLEFEGVNLKCVIEASKMCFKEKQIFTHERLAIVIDKLIELPVIPTLFMRTLMQSFSMYPRMVGYVVNILTKLISKQVWKNIPLWDGFVRCCVKLQQQSFAVLLHLPVDKLENFFNSVGEFRGHMRRYIENYPQKQKLHISSAVLSLINSEPVSGGGGGGASIVATERATISTETAQTHSECGLQPVSATVATVAPSVATTTTTTMATMATTTSNNGNHVTTTTAATTTTATTTTNTNIVKTEKLTTVPSMVKTVMDKEKLEEDRKKKEKTKQLLEHKGNKISFLPKTKGSK